MLCVSLGVSARADDLNARAAQVKTQLQTTLLPALAQTPTANKSAESLAALLQTLSRAHRLGYSTPQHNYLDAARVQYQFLRSAREDKTSGGFYDDASGKNPALAKSSQTQAQVVSALVEYARASGQSEPRGLAIKTWRSLRDRARDKTNGGYYDSFLSGALGPTQASGSGFKSARTHLRLLEAGTALFAFTRDRSIRRDVEELLDLNEGRFFPTNQRQPPSLYTPEWKALTFIVVNLMNPDDFYPRSEVVRAGVAIARAQDALGLPVGWVDFSRRADAPSQPQNSIFLGRALDSLSLLAQNIPNSREQRAAQIDEVLKRMNSQTPDAQGGRALLDFVAAFDSPSSPQ